MLNTEDSPANDPPEPQADLRGSPINGQIPPVAHRWKPGTSGNPAGTRSSGASFKEHLNQLQNYTEKELQKIIADPDAGACRKAAAKSWLTGITQGCRDSMNSILDRTIGKPVATLEMTLDTWQAEQPVKIDAATMEYMQLLSANGRALRAKELEKVKSLPPPTSQ